MNKQKDGYMVDLCNLNKIDIDEEFFTIYEKLKLIFFVILISIFKEKSVGKLYNFRYCIFLSLGEIKLKIEINVEIEYLRNYFELIGGG